MPHREAKIRQDLKNFVYISTFLSFSVHLLFNVHMCASCARNQTHSIRNIIDFAISQMRHLDLFRYRQ